MSKLDAELHKKIFDEQIVTALNHVESQAKPRAIILAGQPGAGKGNVASAALREFKDQAVVVDPDQMRDFYPGVRDLKASNPYSWADKTHEDASQWAKELRAEAIDQRKNLIIDTTLGKYESAAQLVSELREKGYEVEVRALATHRLESELGVEARFSATMGTLGHGRYVPAHIQEEVYAKLPGNLDQLRKVDGVPIRIFDREGTELYDSRKQGTTPGASLKEEREHRLESVDRSRQLAEGWNSQVAWHAGAKTTLESIPDVKPATVAKFLDQREEFGIVRRTTERAAEAQTNLHRLTPPSMTASSSSAAPVRLDDSAHPDHAMYKQALGWVQEMDKKYAHPSDERSTNLAASLTVAARANGMERIDGVAFSPDRSTVVAAQGQPSMGTFNKFATVDTVRGLDTPLAESSQKWPQAMVKFQQEQQQSPTQPQQAHPHQQARL
jgi:predicted ABC-type ATPase